jgi:dolichyl-phosphate beta-glucosyltransferase
VTPCSTQTPSLSIIIPAYNEARRLPLCLERVIAYLDQRGRTYEVLVVDDGSHDQTAQAVESVAHRCPHLRLIRLTSNMGKGAAVRRGMQAARGTYQLFADADGATPIEELARLESALLAGADLAIGSRALASQDPAFTVRARWHRSLLGTVFNNIVQRLGLRDITDTQCGFKLFRRSIAQDLFSVEDGEIFAVTVGLTSLEEERDIADPELITRIQMEYDREKADPGFYGDEASRRILAFYREALDGTIVTFPQTALRCVDTFREMSGGRLLLLSGDKGDHRLEDYQGRDLPSLTLHDTGFSITFNYNALSRYFEDLGGEVLSTSFRATSLNILAFVLGAPATTETRQAFHDFIDLNSPDDNYTGLISAEQNQDISLVELMAVVRMKRYDHHAFLLVWPQFSKKLQGMPEAAIPEIRQMVARVWANYFELGEKHNLPFHLGVLLAAIGDYAGSVAFFERSLQRSPGHTTTLFNLANSLMHLGQRERAFELLRALPEEQQGQPEVVALRERIERG